MLLHFQSYTNLNLEYLEIEQCDIEGEGLDALLKSGAHYIYNILWFEGQFDDFNNTLDYGSNPRSIPGQEYDFNAD